MNLNLKILGIAMAIALPDNTPVAWDPATNTLTAGNGTSTGNPSTPPPQGTGPGGIPTVFDNYNNTAQGHITQWQADNSAFPYSITLDGARIGYPGQAPSVDYSTRVSPGYAVYVGTGVIPADNPNPGNPNPPTLPPGVGHQTIEPPSSGQQKYNFSGPMVLDLVNQPAGKPGLVGFMKTAPQIGGDMDAGGATFEWVAPDGSPQSLSGDAPVTAWYTTDHPNEGALIQAKVGSTIRVSVLNPLKPWFLDYRTPTVG